VGAYLEACCSYKATGGPAPLSRSPEMAWLKPHEVLKKLGLSDINDRKQLAAALRRMVDRGGLGALVQEVGAGPGLAISKDKGPQLAAPRRGAERRCVGRMLCQSAFQQNHTACTHRSGRASCWASSPTA
jgi:hypothetical protein